MKNIKMIALILIASLGYMSPDVTAQAQRGRDRDMVCLYQDIHYQGWEQCYAPGDEIVDLRGRRNAISSIRIFGRARVVVFDDSEFRGTSDEFGNDVPDLDRRMMNGSRSWNDRIGSLRVALGFNGSGRFPQPAPYPGNYPNNYPGNRDRDYRDRDPIVRDAICVFQDSNFRGRSECFDSGIDVRDLSRVAGWNDRISSIRIIGRARAIFYENTAFRGERIVVERDLSDLAILRLRDGANWNDQISSFEVRQDSNGRGLARGRGPRW